MKNIGQKSGDYLYSGVYEAGNKPPDYVHFGEDDQTFYVAQADVNITNSPQFNPDSRDAQKVPYEQSDIGLPEWGIVHAVSPGQVNKYWQTQYRSVTGYGWAGWVLAAHIMGLRDLWNHDALFDYQDRYMQVTAAGGAWPSWRQQSPFAERMWDTYRADYGHMWVMDNPADPYSQGHYIGEVQYPVDDGDGGDEDASSGPVPLAPPADSTFVLGDVNSDGSVNIIDVTLAARHVAELSRLQGDSLRRANVNGDLDGSGQPKIDILDIILIARRAVGLINGF